MHSTLFCILCALASGLELKQTEGKYAYVTMWVNKEGAPAKFFQHTLTKDEMMWLNSAEIGDGGLPMLNGGKIKGSLLEEEGRPTMEQKLRVKMPLRPRNSNYQGILDIAKNLRDVGSQYPLVVLTNAPELKDKDVQAENPNLQLIWLNETDFLDRKCKIGAGHELHFQKLAIWKLTQFDKLIWMDTDIAFSSHVDSAFKLDTKGGDRIYGQIDDYHCDGRNWSPTSGGLCTGMLLLTPNKRHFEGLMLQQRSMQACWGDQSIIGTYFNKGKGKVEAKQFQRDVINFARCQKWQGNMKAWHFSGMPWAKRVGDPEGFARRESGALYNATALKEKAKEKSDKKKAEEAAKEERIKQRKNQKNANLKKKKQEEKANEEKKGKTPLALKVTENKGKNLLDRQEKEAAEERQEEMKEIVEEQAQDAQEAGEEEAAEQTE